MRTSSPSPAWASSWIFGAIGIAALFYGWSVAAHWLNNAILLPSPLAMLDGLREVFADGTLAGDVRASLQRVFVGFALAAGVAVPLSLFMAYWRPLRQLLLPVLTLLRPIPPIAWIPLAILWFGITDKSSYFITALAAFFPIFLNALAGGLAVEPQHLHAARCLGATRTALLRRIFLPSALPAVWTGLKIGLGQSWMAVVTAELVAAQSGLGYMIQINRIQLETPRVLAGMFVIAVLGALMTSVLGWLERYIFPWTHTR
jgi:ABC-type nitrate/sulfonate/bicarbonate transport system permease component